MLKSAVEARQILIRGGTYAEVAEAIGVIISNPESSDEDLKLGLAYGGFVAEQASIALSKRHGVPLSQNPAYPNRKAITSKKLAESEEAAKIFSMEPENSTSSAVVPAHEKTLQQWMNELRALPAPAVWGLVTFAFGIVVFIFGAGYGLATWGHGDGKEAAIPGKRVAAPPPRQIDAFQLSDRRKYVGREFVLSDANEVVEQGDITGWTKVLVETLSHSQWVDNPRAFPPDRIVVVYESEAFEHSHASFAARIESRVKLEPPVGFLVQPGRQVYAPIGFKADDERRTFRFRIPPTEPGDYLLIIARFGEGERPDFERAFKVVPAE